MANNAKYFEKGRGPGNDYDKGSNQYTGNTKLKDGYSFVAHQDSPEPISFTQTKTAKKGGGFDLGEKKYIYEKVEQKQAPAQQAAPAAEPEKPKDDLVIKQRGPVKNSPKIQDAKERVNKFQQNSENNSVYTPSFQSNQPSLDLEKYKFNAQGAN